MVAFSPLRYANMLLVYVPIIRKRGTTLLLTKFVQIYGRKNIASLAHPDASIDEKR